MDDDDRFAWISDRCDISATQEEILRNTPFVVPNCDVIGLGANIEEHVSSEEDDDEMRDVETVVMVSVSESSEERSGKEEEEYRTPPERHSHPLTSSNEARIGAGEDEVECVVEDSLEKTVDLGRECLAGGGEIRVENLSVCEDGLVEKGECFPNTVLVSESVGVDESAVETVKLGESIADGVDGGRVDANVIMEVEAERRYQCPGAVGVSEKCVVEKGGECYSGVTKGVELVAEGNPGSSANDEIMGTFGNTETESGMCSKDEGVDVNELKRKGKNVVNEVKRAKHTATNTCVLGNSSSAFRILPSSFCTSSKGDGGDGTRQSSGRPGTPRENGSAGASDGNNEPGSSDAHGITSKKASEPSEPSEEELTNNLLKVLGFLAKPQKPVYKEKVDIIGAAIKAGITFPRPSWWPEDSDDDSD